jgi:hypothetical protein
MATAVTSKATSAGLPSNSDGNPFAWQAVWDRDENILARKLLILDGSWGQDDTVLAAAPGHITLGDQARSGLTGGAMLDLGLVAPDFADYVYSFNEPTGSLHSSSGSAVNPLTKAENATIVDVLVASVLKKVSVDWHRFVIAGVSDVQEARSVYLIPSDMQLTLFEREVAQEQALVQLRREHRRLLKQLREVFDVVLIDCLSR